MHTKQVGILKDGIPVFERHHSHIHTEYERIYELVKQMCTCVTSGEDFIVYTHDFNEVVGKTICIPTSVDDNIVYAVRERRKGATRFVKKREPQESTQATMVLMQDKVGNRYILITAYIGSAAPPEPWDPHAPAHAKSFWSGHALVYGSVPMVAGTETSVCPW
jgi:hypothetical protein